jgi:hypothetical protein
MSDSFDDSRTAGVQVCLSYDDGIPTKRHHMIDMTKLPQRRNLAIRCCGCVLDTPNTPLHLVGKERARTGG